MKNDCEAQLKRLLPRSIELHWMEETDSTQTQAKSAFLKDGPKERLHFALSQTAGRGRTGRTFFSPKNEGLYMTLTLQIPAKETTECLYLTTVAAVAVRRAIYEICHVETDIKWVNDLYYQGKKVCGILVEASPKNGWFLVGVGVNLSTADFPQELKEKAGALMLQANELTDEGGFPALRNKLAAAIVGSLKELALSGMTPAVFEEYQKHSLLIGREITFSQNGEELRGVAKGLTKSCGLLVDCDGQTIELTSGMILDFSKKRD